MLKSHQIILGFLLATALWTILIALNSDSSAYYQICQINEHIGQESCAPHHIPYVVAWYFGYWLDKSSSVITGFATAIIAWFTWTLWRSSEKSWRISERALLDLERGCLVPSFPIVVGSTDPHWHILIVLSNVGRSYAIAKGVFLRTAENVSALPAIPPAEGYAVIETDTVLRPGDDFDGLQRFEMPNTNEGQVLYGYIRYEDNFDRMRRNHFAVAIWSQERPGRPFFQTVGGRAYNTETLENDNRA